MGNISKLELLQMLSRMEDELMSAEAERIEAIAGFGAARTALAQQAEAVLQCCNAVVASAPGALTCDATRKLFDTHAGLTLRIGAQQDADPLTVSLRIAGDGEVSVAAERAGDSQRHFRGKVPQASLAATLEQVLDQAFPQA